MRLFCSEEEEWKMLKRAKRRRINSGNVFTPEFFMRDRKKKSARGKTSFSAAVRRLEREKKGLARRKTSLELFPQIREKEKLENVPLTSIFRAAESRNFGAPLTHWKRYAHCTRKGFEIRKNTEQLTWCTFFLFSPRADFPS